MRHQKKRHRLGRTTSHRKATLAALSTALIQHKRITTTEPKAKALRVFIEPLITRAKEDTSHNRRQVFRRLQDNDAVSELFTEVSAQVGDRPGGYTRVVKLGRRAGDGAALAVIELVDYNDVQPDEGESGRSSRTRRGGGKGRRRSRSKDAETQPPAAVDASTETTKQVEAASKDVEPDVVEKPVAEEQTQPIQARTEDEVPEEQVEAAKDASDTQKAEPAGQSAAEGAVEEPKAEDESRAEGELEAKGESKAEAEPKAEAESKAEAEPKAKAESKAEVEPKAEGDPEAKDESKALGEPKAEQESKAEGEAKGESKAEAEPKAKAESKAEAEPKAKAESKAEGESEADDDSNEKK